MLVWVCAFVIILFTTSPQDIIAAMKRLKLPSFMILSLSMTLRFWYLILADVRVVMEAQRCRGVNYQKGNPLTWAPWFASSLIPVIFLLLERFRTMRFALALKGVGPGHAPVYTI